MKGGGRQEQMERQRMAKKKFTVTEILNYKRRAQEIADIFGDDLKQDITLFYIKYIESKKDALLENYLQAERDKREEKNKQWKDTKNNNQTSGSDVH